MSACVDRFGGIDGLVNVGAEMEMARKELGHDLLDMNVADWQRTLRVNLVGHALTIGAAIPHLVAAGWRDRRGVVRCGTGRIRRSAGLRGVEGRSQCSRAARCAALGQRQHPLQLHRPRVDSQRSGAALPRATQGST